MANVATMKLELTCEGANGVTLSHDPPAKRWSPATALAGGQRQTVSLPATTNTAITVPTGAKLMAILLPTSAISIQLKGNNSDTGVSLSPSSNALGADCVLSLGATPTPILYNGDSSATSCEVIFL